MAQTAYETSHYLSPWREGGGGGGGGGEGRGRVIGGFWA